MRLEEWLQAACDSFVNQGFGDAAGEVVLFSSAVAGRTSTLAPSEVFDSLERSATYPTCAFATPDSIAAVVIH